MTTTILTVIASSTWAVEAGRVFQSDFVSASSSRLSCVGDAAPALFVFGASYMDLGENFAAMPFRAPSDFLPYGVDFFASSTGRSSNGRLILTISHKDWAKKFLSPCLQDAGTNFQHGVSFASLGSKACNSTIQDTRRFFPTPRAFSKGVYIIEIGNNDYGGVSSDQVDALIPLVLRNIELGVQTLYNEGTRTIVIMDAFSVGCFPFYLFNYTHLDQLNEDGCVIPVTKIIGHNAGLKVMVTNLSVELVEAKLILFSLYDVFMSAIWKPSKFGLKYVHKACCGYEGGDYNYNTVVRCGKDGILNGELQKVTVCENQSEFMLWDHMHPTNAFAFYIAQAFLRGEHMQPAFHIKEMYQYK